MRMMLDISFITQEFNRAEMLDKAKKMPIK